MLLVGPLQNAVLLASCIATMHASSKHLQTRVWTRGLGSALRDVISDVLHKLTESLLKLSGGFKLLVLQGLGVLVRDRLPIQASATGL